MTDVLDQVRTAFADVHMADDPEKIMAAGRARRRQRRGAIGIAAGTAAAAGLAMALPSGGSTPTGPPPTPGVVHVHLADFSVDTNADGSVTATITKRQLLNPTTLEHTLNQAGVPAVIRIGEFCTAGHVQGTALDQIMTVGRAPDGRVLVTFHPRAVPPGVALSIGLAGPHATGRTGATVGLIKTDAKLTCTPGIGPKTP